MNRTARVAPLLIVALLSLTASMQADPQETAPPPASIEVDPEQVTIEVGSAVQVTAMVRDGDGNVLDDVQIVYVSRARRRVGVNPAGTIEAYKPGDVEVVAIVPSSPDVDPRRDDDALRAVVAVHVPVPPLASIAFTNMPGRYYTGTIVRPVFEAVDVSGASRADISPVLESSDNSVVEIDHVGSMRLVGRGTAMVTARAEEVRDSIEVRVSADPTASLRMTSSASEVRTGEVVHLEATPLGGDGTPVPEMPVVYAFRARTDQHGLGEPPSGLVTADGRFVADLPGEYTILATAGQHWASTTVVATPRNVRRDIELVGHGRVADRKTSDLWVWEAPDGGDYAITGTWGAAGHAYVWDVTDPRNIQLIDMVKVDARTVNDVKVSEDGSIAVISREGASDRRNGLVILDVSTPRDGVKVLARYDDQMTGGVHNVYIHDDHIYALSGGRRYDVLNIEDPRNPYRVGRFELDSPGRSIHDVWVIDGVAVSSNWDDGVVLVDVGGGGMGGSPVSPVEMARYAYPSGWNHAAWPFKSSSGRFYVIAGDEAFPRERNPMGLDRFEGPPVQAAGWIHFIDFDDLENPREVARYQVPFGGTHNFWVDGDTLYVAYYNAGLRVIDISGELLGDLYRQGREIGYFLADDPQGFKPNARRTWGAMTHKGNIFFADNNSGLWAVRLKPDADADTAGAE